MPEDMGVSVAERIRRFNRKGRMQAVLVLGLGVVLLGGGNAPGDEPGPAQDRVPLLDPEEFLSFVEIIPGEETFPGKGTKARFAREAVIGNADTSFSVSALGSGIRKKFVFKVYEGVAYAETGRDLGPAPYATLIRGNFPKRIHMFFERDVDGKKIRKSYRDRLRKILGKEGWEPALAADFEIFLSYFEDSGIKDGQSIDLIWLPGYGLHVVIVDESFPPINNPRLASALWAVWFGDDPVSGGLKKDMLRFLPGRGN